MKLLILLLVSRLSFFVSSEDGAASPENKTEHFSTQQQKLDQAIDKMIETYTRINGLGTDDMDELLQRHDEHDLVMLELENNFADLLDVAYETSFKISQTVWNLNICIQKTFETKVNETEKKLMDWEEKTAESLQKLYDDMQTFLNKKIDAFPPENVEKNDELIKQLETLTDQNGAANHFITESNKILEQIKKQEDYDVLTDNTDIGNEYTKAKSIFNEQVNKLIKLQTYSTQLLNALAQIKKMLFDDPLHIIYFFIEFNPMVEQIDYYTNVISEKNLSLSTFHLAVIPIARIENKILEDEAIVQTVSEGMMNACGLEEDIASSMWELLYTDTEPLFKEQMQKMDEFIKINLVDDINKPIMVIQNHSDKIANTSLMIQQLNPYLAYIRYSILTKFMALVALALLILAILIVLCGLLDSLFFKKRVGDC